MKTTCMKSWPGNLFQVLNLTIDSCFKVKSRHHTKTSLFHPYYGCYGFRKIDHEKSWPANVLPEKILALF